MRALKVVLELPHACIPELAINFGHRWLRIPVQAQAHRPTRRARETLLAPACHCFRLSDESSLTL